MSIPPPTLRPENDPQAASEPRAEGAPPGFDPPSPGFAGTHDVQFAGWWLRVEAALFDGVAVGISLLVLNVALLVAGIGSSPSGTLLRWLVGFGLSAGYYIRTMTRSGDRNGQTLGKQQVGIRVVRDDGRPVNVGTVLRREVIIKGLLGAVSLGIFGLLDDLWPLGDATNRALHDKMVRTHVVTEPGRSPSARATFKVVAGAFIGIFLVGLAVAVAIPLFLIRQPVSAQQNDAQVQALERDMGVAFAVDRQAALRSQAAGLDTGTRLVGDIAAAEPGLDSVLASGSDPGPGSAQVGVIYLGASTPTAFEAVGYTADRTRVDCGVTSGLGAMCRVTGG
jgi:uncharacterized RDD family membrane protein YckC